MKKVLTISFFFTLFGCSHKTHNNKINDDTYEIIYQTRLESSPFNVSYDHTLKYYFQNNYLVIFIDSNQAALINFTKDLVFTFNSNRTVRLIQREAENEKKHEITKYKDERNIHGYSCRKVVADFGDKKATLWIADEIKLPKLKFVKGLDISSFILSSEIRGLPLEMSITRKFGFQDSEVLEEIISFSATSIKINEVSIPDSLLTVDRFKIDTLSSSFLW